ncbi:MAG: hypothetical protein UHS41_06890 [Lachnospiraceae bacterium]|nr:hypothetical protein [Lachnospiraceae bacterium]
MEQEKRTNLLMKKNLIPGGRKKKKTLEKLFSQISVIDYAAMWIIARLMEYEDHKGKLYLNEISSELQIPMKEVTKIVQNLTNRGLVSWTHDGDGSEGTYIQITDNGSESVEEQQHTLHDFYIRVVKRFGKDKFMMMVSLVGEFEQIMSEEMEKTEKRLEVNGEA